MPSEKHEALVAELVAEGWSTGGWCAAAKRDAELRREVDLFEVLREKPTLVPDAWRVRTDPDGFITYELAEVELSNQISERKRLRYAALFWAFDGTEAMHFRVFVVNRFGDRVQVPWSEFLVGLGWKGHP